MKTRKRSPLCIVVLIVAMISGCETMTAGDEAPAGRLERLQEPQYLPIAQPAAVKAARALMPEDERKVFSDSVSWSGGFMSNAARHLVMTTETWQEADQGVRKTIDRFREETVYVAEQLAALWMLDVALLGGEMTPERQEAIAYYTRMLLRNESPAAVVIERSLGALAGYWSEAQRHEAALATVRHAEAWLDEKAGSGTAAKTMLAGQAQGEALLDAQARRMVAIRGAVEALEMLGNER